MDDNAERSKELALSRSVESTLKVLVFKYNSEKIPIVSHKTAFAFMNFVNFIN